MAKSKRAKVVSEELVQAINALASSHDPAATLAALVSPIIEAKEAGELSMSMFLNKEELTKEQQIEAAWAMHNGKPGVLSCDPSGPRGPGGAIHIPKEPKVIFADREAIQACYDAWRKRKDEAIRARKAKAAASALYNGNGYQNLADLQAIAK